MKKIYETLYPNDAAGYRCYSVLVWEVELERTYDWGTLRVYILEGRFIWCGVLLHHVFEMHRHNKDELMKRAETMDENWRWCIDLLLEADRNNKC